MITFSYANSIPVITDEYCIVNLSSLVDLPNVPIWNVTPPFELLQMVSCEEEFDNLYYNYVMTNPPIFNEFFKVLNAHHMNIHVIVLCDHRHEHLLSISESLMKIIQFRYAINCNVVYEAEDWDYIKFTDFTTVEGIANFDVDNDMFIQNTIPVDSIGIG